MKEIFLVIGKLPIKGFSKTRLEKDLGEATTQKLYDAFIRDFFYNYSRRCDLPLYFLGTPESIETKNYFESIMQEHAIDFSFDYQNEKPFFQRIQQGFVDIQEKYGECFVHLTGTDIPDFPFDHIAKDKAITLGGDEDGGFYYFGLPSKYSSVFDMDGREGGETVFEMIKKRTLNLGLSVCEAPLWSDIDDLEDLKNCLLRTNRDLCPHLSCTIVELKLSI